MEATKEGTGLLDQIVPPRLEDAGLEDCALPPDLIKEAFLKAASAVKSRATLIFSDEDEYADCVQDPWPEKAKFASHNLVGVPPVPGASDALGGIEMGKETPGSCVAEKGGGMMEAGGDKVVVVGGEVEEIENERGDCLGVGLKKKDENGSEAEEEEGREGERPTLAEGFIVSYGLCQCLFQDPVVMPRVVKCLTASARGSFKDLTPIRHKGMKGLCFNQWQRSDQELEMKVGVIFIRDFDAHWFSETTLVICASGCANILSYLLKQVQNLEMTRNVESDIGKPYLVVGFLLGISSRSQKL
ncbi:hypothetical protein SADUNF_Sadunf03G0030800 [Salix dunnii]|uniref:Uncharacterized protein n=1 Tax=Salix dunnii TaxID=1413687 RepID=A0A835K9I4_9ROSI|nr:hypothetical protein SADUNF_Sadunf03G0030800 [Salix dunnii]